MKLKSPVITLALLATATLAHAGRPSTTGALGTRANLIVGLWSNIVHVGPCGGTAGITLRQTLMFQAGGTFVDNSVYPPQGVSGPNGVEQRSIGLGTWSYNPSTSQFYLNQRFDWYVNNQYNGYQVVERTNMLLSNDGEHLASGVHTVRYAANGAVIVELCGSASSTRL